MKRKYKLIVVIMLLLIILPKNAVYAKGNYDYVVDGCDSPKEAAEKVYKKIKKSIRNKFTLEKDDYGGSDTERAYEMIVSYDYSKTITYTVSTKIHIAVQNGIMRFGCDKISYGQGVDGKEITGDGWRNVNGKLVGTEEGWKDNARKTLSEFIAERIDKDLWWPGNFSLTASDISDEILDYASRSKTISRKFCKL